MGKELTRLEAFRALDEVDDIIITEGIKATLGDTEEIETAKKALYSTDDDTVEQVIDLNATVEDDLRKPHAGDGILQCPVCKVYIFRKPEELVKSTETYIDDEGNTKFYYNTEMVCPHCGQNESGFMLTNQVAALNDETSEEATEDDIDTTDWDALLKDDSVSEPTETETTEEAEVEDENSKEEVKLTDQEIELKEEVLNHDTPEEKHICSICGKEYKGYGNNASPVKDGKCCDKCNDEVVIPARIKNLVIKEDTEIEIDDDTTNNTIVTAEDAINYLNSIDLQAAAAIVNFAYCEAYGDKNCSKLPVFAHITTIQDYYEKVLPEIDKRCPTFHSNKYETSQEEFAASFEENYGLEFHIDSIINNFEIFECLSTNFIGYTQNDKITDVIGDTNAIDTLFIKEPQKIDALIKWCNLAKNSNKLEQFTTAFRNNGLNLNKYLIDVALNMGLKESADQLEFLAEELTAENAPEIDAELTMSQIKATLQHLGQDDWLEDLENNNYDEYMRILEEHWVLTTKLDTTLIANSDIISRALASAGDRLSIEDNPVIVIRGAVGNEYPYAAIDVNTATEILEAFDDTDREVELESFDTNTFEELTNKFLNKVYENVDSFKVTQGILNENNIIIDGTIKFKSGKTKNSRFVFEQTKRKLSKNNVKYVGINETFTKESKRPFTLTATINNNELVFDTLKYKFVNESVLVADKVETLQYLTENRNKNRKTKLN